MPVFERNSELLRSFRHGDRAALEVVYRHYVNDVWGLLRSGFATGSEGARVPGLTDTSALRDGTQDVFTRAFAEPARLAYDGLRPYRPYLLRIARNARIDQLRRSGREVLMADPLSASRAGDQPNEPAADPAELLHWEAQQAATRAYIAGLDAEQQRYVELRFVQELSQVDVAARMSVTRRRARTLESYVLAGLRKALEQQGFR